MEASLSLCSFELDYLELHLVMYCGPSALALDGLPLRVAGVLMRHQR